ncbi:glycosyltransferase family 2 protein [Sphingobacterium multivorum]|uniref:Chondroitin polymerase n=1 Tax=Sphingobacterium multivorum TaxID=28454 RepID=A0A2X2J3Q3_SPHMU|nr:glycosyltransferase family 2 protein [Sphingobacterium multivorum]QRQ61298.1 glycosyltransferase family 2 protein [Sphingobacterium multivorum]SPZ88648.1 Chondroitin polymerase [Sphingobacterium multivorum]
MAPQINLENYPLVSITMSTYNGEQFLEEQLQTLIEQDYPNIEIIVCDDHSSDQTWQILQKWQIAYPKLIQIFSNPENIGWSRNFGEAISHAKGQFIAWCDQDDKWMSDKISAMVETFKKNPDASLVYHDAIQFRGDNETIVEKKDYFHWGTFQGTDPVSLFWHCRILGHRMMFKGELKKYILPAISTSYDWWIQVLAASIGRVYYIDKKLVAQRKHENNATGAKDPNMIGDCLLGRLQMLEKFQIFRPLMKEKDGILLDKMTAIMRNHKRGKFDWTLFFFVLKYRYRLHNFLEGSNALGREIFRWRLARSWAKNW